VNTSSCNEFVLIGLCNPLHRGRRSRDGQRGGERHIDSKTARQRDRETERQKDRETERQRDRETERLRERETEKQRNI